MFLFLSIWLSITVSKSQGVDEGWCPQFHLIRSPGVCDASGPIKIGEQWHVFEDSCGWCHWISDDLIHWKQVNSTPFTTITGSIGYPNNGNNVIAFYGEDSQSYIFRATNNIVKDSTLQTWNLTGTYLFIYLFIIYLHSDSN